MTSRSVSRSLLAALLWLAFAPDAAAQPRPGGTLPPQPAAEAVGVAAARIERHRLAAPWRATAFRIQVWRPLAPPGPGGYPVVYLLDGNAVFESLAQAGIAASAVPAVLVGIGYDTDDRFNAADRAVDTTPPSPGAEHPPVHPGDPPAAAMRRPGGGADRFLDWLETSLKPFVAARYPVDPDRATLYGHSFGGLLVLHTLLTRPAAFQGYVAASPSLWWNGGVILREVETALARAGEAAAAGTTAQRRLLLMSGSRERDGLASARDPAMLARRLEALGGLSVRFREFDGLGHGPMLTASIGPAIRFAAGTAVDRP